MKNTLTLFALCFFVVLSAKVVAQDTLLLGKTVFQELYQRPEEVVELTIETPFRNIIQKKGLEELKKATLRYTGGDGQPVQHELQIRARGNRRKVVCYFPPLKMKFSKSALTQAGYAPFHEIKLANSCRPGETNNLYLFKEYLGYRLYNLVSPYSFRVKLAKITYLDVDREGQSTELYAILIEPEAELCARLGAQVIERKLTYGVFVEPFHLGQMEVFQYMIGNTDWNLSNRHNIATIKAPEKSKLIAIPYDFDYSGLVGTDYAEPNESLPIQDVGQRYHKGEAFDPETIRQVGENFLGLTTSFQQACRDLNALSPRAAKETEAYLAPFFKMLNDSRRMKQVFVEKIN